jgi:hypothetical protein
MEIQNYPNYLIYPDGRVWSKPRPNTKGGFIKQLNHKCGYKIVILCKDGKLKKITIHRLVAIHYIPNPHDYPHVDHIDRDKTNNDVSNLRWVTPSQNSQNTGKPITNTSGVKNVYYHKRHRHWRYQKTIDGKRLSKTFTSKPLACWCKFIFELKL